MVIRCYFCLWLWETASTKSYSLSLQFILKEHLVCINVLITWKFVWLFKISENHKKGHEWPNFSGSTYFLSEKRPTLLKIKGSIFIISYDVKENNTKRAIKAVKRLKWYMVWKNGFGQLHVDNITDVTLAWDDEEPQAHKFILWT